MAQKQNILGGTSENDKAEISAFATCLAAIDEISGASTAKYYMTKCRYCGASCKDTNYGIKDDQFCSSKCETDHLSGVGVGADTPPAYLQLFSKLGETEGATFNNEKG